jgi:hypothetical protein
MQQSQPMDLAARFAVHDLVAFVDNIENVFRHNKNSAAHVAQIANLPCRRMAFGNALTLAKRRSFFAAADCHSALRRLLLRQTMQ